MISPMLAKEADKPFTDPNWLYELKLDGVRCIAYVDGEIRLQARSGADITKQFPEVKVEVAGPCILDGEIVARSLKFKDVASRVHTQKPWDIKIGVKQLPCVYHVFDILEYGESLLNKPLEIRKAILAGAYRPTESSRLLPHWADGIELMRQVKVSSLEGIMAKRKVSTYQVGKRSGDWLKIKAWQEDIFQIYGLTKGERDTFASLILGKDGGFVGCVGTGFSDRILTDLLQMLKPLAAKTTNLSNLKLDREVLFFTEPRVSCEVRYLEYGSDGHLRFPSYRRLV